MAEIRLRGLVLRETDFGDYDRYLSLLTEDGRRTEILHRNAKRSRKHAASAQQFCFSEFIVSERGGRYSFRDASLIHSFFPLSQDIERPRRRADRLPGALFGAADRAFRPRKEKTRPRAREGGA